MPWQQTENATEQAVVHYAEERGIMQTKLNLMGQRGWPDRCFWIPGGRPLLMEFKRRGKRPRKLQQRIIDKLQRLGYDAHCIDRKEEGFNIIRDAIVKVALQATFNRVVKTIQERILYGASAEGKGKLVNLDGILIRRGAEARTVGAQAAPQNRVEVSAGAGVRRTVRGSGHGQDQHQSGRRK